MTNQELFRHLCHPLAPIPTLELLTEYTQADMIIYRCPNCRSNLWATIETLNRSSQYNGRMTCEFCGHPFNRLLASGEWQGQNERDQLNQVEYQKVSG